MSQVNDKDERRPGEQRQVERDPKKDDKILKEKDRLK
jgi:hypothetical protein